MQVARGAIVAAAVAALVAGNVAAAFAQNRDGPLQPPPSPHGRQRIHIPAGRQFYRECVDGYREIWRPYWHETVIMPYLECHWVNG
jgi:hypothetical protein